MQPIEPVSPFVLSRFLGRWYELASLPQRHEGSCTDVVSDYEAGPDGVLTITTSCKAGKSTVSIKGTAREVQPGQFSVSFPNSPPVDATVIGLDADYQSAMIGSQDRKVLWVLARSAQINEDQLNTYIAHAHQLGYPVMKLQQMQHAAAS